MKHYKKRKCDDCHAEYLPTHPASKRCESCQEKNYAKLHALKVERAKAHYRNDERDRYFRERLNETAF